MWQVLGYFGICWSACEKHFRLPQMDQNPLKFNPLWHTKEKKSHVLQDQTSFSFPCEFFYISFPPMYCPQYRYGICLKTVSLLSKKCCCSKGVYICFRNYMYCLGWTCQVTSIMKLPKGLQHAIFYNYWPKQISKESSLPVCPLFQQQN